MSDTVSYPSTPLKTLAAKVVAASSTAIMLSVRYSLLVKERLATRNETIGPSEYRRETLEDATTLQSRTSESKLGRGPTSYGVYLEIEGMKTQSSLIRKYCSIQLALKRCCAVEFHAGELQSDATNSEAPHRVA